jgi:hypothetical protein
MSAQQQVVSKAGVKYILWRLRGFAGKVWQVYVEVNNSHSLSQLIEVKKQLNSPPVTGMVLVENRSPALKRLGWRKIDDGLYGKVFP